MDLIFQSTLPRGERLGSGQKGGGYGFNFNPRSREGSDFAIQSFGKKEGDFNPRSREGSDVMILAIGIALCGFQSTLPRGERLSITNESIDFWCISIHAPARGATYVTIPDTEEAEFQSTLPRGERPIFPLRHEIFWTEFQSTLPRGERHGLKPAISAPTHFNPRSREGSDVQQSGGDFLKYNFNPRSREGSDIVIAQQYIELTISIHAPARGATMFVQLKQRYSLFQSTLPRGERR